MKNKIYLLVILAMASFSCEKNQVFDHSPAERNSMSIKELKKELTTAPYGWRVVYFSKTDSLLFTNHKEVLTTGYRDRYGIGGHYFLMNFSSDGNVEMLADYNEQTITNSKTSEFKIDQNTYTQLSFTTYTYLHELVNELFMGACDFLYVGKDLSGHLVFKTPSKSEPAREYMVFEKLNSEEEQASYIQKAYENRILFERMKNPQLVIRQGSRIFFKSDYFIKSETQANKKWLPQIIKQRFYVFLYNKKPEALTPELTGLGGGYTGTEQGLTFRSGLRYNKSYIFYDFQRQGNKFVCELVKVYDMKTRTTRWMSKHLAPDGEATGVIAEISDQPLK